jgi:hypothetical protein
MPVDDDDARFHYCTTLAKFGRAADYNDGDCALEVSRVTYADLNVRSFQSCFYWRRNRSAVPAVSERIHVS